MICCWSLFESCLLKASNILFNWSKQSLIRFFFLERLSTLNVLVFHTNSFVIEILYKYSCLITNPVSIPSSSSCWSFKKKYSVLFVGVFQ